MQQSTKGDRWVVVRCPECRRVLCKVTAGSVVKITCKRCKAESVTHAA